MALPPHTSATSVITKPQRSVHIPANKTGGVYPKPTFITVNADPQNATNNTNARVA